MSWLVEYSRQAEATDQLTCKTDHVGLLAAGVFSEAGSIFAEIKKKGRERLAYPAYRNRLLEETGDLIWYLTRLTAILSPSLLSTLAEPLDKADVGQGTILKSAFSLGDKSGSLFGALQKNDTATAAALLSEIWMALFQLCRLVEIEPNKAAIENVRKITGRWPKEKIYSPLFDDNFLPEEQLPRKLDVEFRQITRNHTTSVLLRCKELNIGDRLTDNISDPDYYRYHDVLHFSHAVHLGWSPVLRSLLRCKRKSVPELDHNQDGARAAIIEEAVSAIVFSRAKEMNMFDEIEDIDYELLKLIGDFVKGFEVENIPPWQWNVAISEGYRVFRLLCKNQGGIVSLNLVDRTLLYQPLN